MNAVETTLEPPAPADPVVDEHEDDREVDVTLWITEADGSRRSASIALPPAREPTTDYEELADAIIACVRAGAELHGPGLVEAISRRVL